MSRSYAETPLDGTGYRQVIGSIFLSGHPEINGPPVGLDGNDQTLWMEKRLLLHAVTNSQGRNVLESHARDWRLSGKGWSDQDEV